MITPLSEDWKVEGVSARLIVTGVVAVEGGDKDTGVETDRDAEGMDQQTNHTRPQVHSRSRPFWTPQPSRRNAMYSPTTTPILFPNVNDRGRPTAERKTSISGTQREDPRDETDE